MHDDMIDEELVYKHEFIQVTEEEMEFILKNIKIIEKLK